jgi:hypothetical protein
VDGVKATIRFKTLLLIFLFPLVFLIASSFSQPPERGMRLKPWRGEAKCWKASELNLTQEQTKALDTLQEAFFRETQLLRAQVLSKRLELRELLIHPATKTETIRLKSSEIQEHQAKLEEKALEYLIRVKTLLNQDQLRNWCPEMEFPPFRRMMQGPDSMGPPSPRRLPSQEGIKPE